MVMVDGLCLPVIKRKNWGIEGMQPTTMQPTTMTAQVSASLVKCGISMESRVLCIYIQRAYVHSPTRVIIYVKLIECNSWVV